MEKEPSRGWRVTNVFPVSLKDLVEICRFYRDKETQYAELKSLIEVRDEINDITLKAMLGERAEGLDLIMLASKLERIVDDRIEITRREGAR